MSENTSSSLFNTSHPPIFFLQHLLCFVSLFNLQSFPKNRVLESAKFLTAINTLKKLQRIEREPLTCVFDLYIWSFSTMASKWRNKTLQLEQLIVLSYGLKQNRM